MRGQSQICMHMKQLPLKQHILKDLLQAKRIFADVSKDASAETGSTICAASAILSIIQQQF